MKFFEWLTGRREPTDQVVLDHEERRKLPRLRCFLKLDARENPKEPHDAYMLDLSGKGLRLHCHLAFATGQVLNLKCVTPNPVTTVPAKIIWTKERKNSTAVMGARFLLPQEKLKETWVGHILQQLGFPVNYQETLEARHSIRYPTHLPATLQSTDDLIDITVLDIGRGGALIESTGEIGEGAILELPEPPGLSAKLRLVCRCINVRLSPVEGRLLCHLKWVYLTPDETKKLGLVLSRLATSQS